METLRPQLIWIGDRCYRKNPTDKTNFQNEENEEVIVAEDTPDLYADEVCDAFTNVEETEHGFRLAMDIPSAYFKYIIGKKAETKRRLENDTQSQIRIPRMGQEGEVVIQSKERKNVISAKNRIEILVDSARQKQPFTHFLSFPINGGNIKQKFQEFKERVLQDCGQDRGIDESIFQNPEKLHLTLGVMPLLNDKEIAKASELLQTCLTDIVEPICRGAPLVSLLQGLEYMNDDPGSVDVLYAKIELKDGSDRLQNIADRVVDRFVSAGLMQRQYDKVKLHGTVMNTLMRKDPTGASEPRSNQGSRSSGPQRESFDARNVLKTYGDFSFGEHYISSLHLSQRHSVGKDSYYTCAAKLEVP